MRFGIMSFAHVHADGFASILGSLPDTQLVGISDPDTKQGQQAAERYGVRYFDDHSKLLAEGLDAVVICSENAQHKVDVELAARAGVHILCEKPIATTTEDALKIKSAIDAAGINFMTAFPMRFDVSILAIKALLERGDLGRVQAINGINHSEIPRRHRAWFSDKALAGGGAVMDHTVHLLDLYRWLLGDEVAQVYATVSHKVIPELEVDTAGLATVTFKNGVFAAIDCSWSRTEAIYPRWGHLKMDIIGEQGATSVDCFNQYLNLYSRKTARQANWLGWGNDPNVAMVTEFIASVREKRDPAITWQDGYEALRVALACYDSSAAATPVQLA